MRSPEVRAIGRRVRHVLLTVWDPVGVGEIPQAQDEYDSYIWPIVAMLKEGAGVEALAAHLLAIETDRMGMSGTHSPSGAAAAALIEIDLSAD